MAGYSALFNYREADYEGRTIQAPYSKYKYTPCDPEKAIRLLEVLPSKDFEDIIRCKLREYPSDNPPYYSALSYEWGDPSKGPAIYIDDVPFPATWNLHHALAELRARKCPELWVDAFCINQSDVVERNAHINKMSEIFNKADTVTVWLGPQSRGSEIVMSILRAIYFSRHPKPGESRDAWNPDLRLLARHHRELEAFMNRSYFNRVWVIQEIAWASQVTVHCGPQFVSWRAFPILMNQIEQRSSPDYVWHDLEHLKLHQLNRLCSIRSGRIQGKPAGILQLLSESADSKATDARDKLYALLGLATDRQLYIKQPHYEWTIQDICLEMTKDIVKSRHSLDIIIAAQRSSDASSDLPTWCPDYTRWPSDATTASLSAYISGQGQRHRHGKMCVRWNATSDSVATRSNTDFLSNGDLQVRGAPIATIESLTGSRNGLKQDEKSQQADSPTTLNDDQILERITQALLFYRRDEDTGQQGTPWDYNIHFFLFHFPRREEPLRPSRNRRRTPDLRTLDSWRAENGDFPIRGKTLRKRASAIRWDSLAAFYRVRNLLYTLVQYGWRFPGQPPLSPTLEITMTQLHTDVEDALLDLQSLVEEGLRFMRTSDYRFGWAHPHAVAGDEIFLIAGCSMPVILRAVVGGGGGSGGDGDNNNNNNGDSGGSGDSGGDSGGGGGGGDGGGDSGGSGSNCDGDGGGQSTSRPSSSSSSSSSTATTKYRVVGHAYLAGAMDSEIWSSTPASDLSTIMLC